MSNHNKLPHLVVPSGLDPALTQFLTNLKEHVERATGARSSASHRYVTFQELLDAGIIGSKKDSGGRLILTAPNADVERRIAGHITYEPGEKGPRLYSDHGNFVNPIITTIKEHTGGVIQFTDVLTEIFRFDEVLVNSGVSDPASGNFLRLLSPTQPFLVEFHALVRNLHATLTASAVFTCQVSFDGGSTWRFAGSNLIDNIYASTNGSGFMWFPAYIDPTRDWETAIVRIAASSANPSVTFQVGRPTAMTLTLANIGQVFGSPRKII